MIASRSTLIGLAIFLALPPTLAQSAYPMTARQPAQVAPANMQPLPQPAQAQLDETEMRDDRSSSGASESSLS